MPTNDGHLSRYTLTYLDPPGEGSDRRGGAKHEDVAKAPSTTALFGLETTDPLFLGGSAVCGKVAGGTAAAESFDSPAR